MTGCVFIADRNIYTEEQILEWDRDKHLLNIRKHGITFKIAAKAFFDPQAVIIEDEKHSHNEVRFILIGASEVDKMLTVCHCYKNDGDVVRIISARLPNQYEKKVYETGGAIHGF